MAQAAERGEHEQRRAYRGGQLPAEDAVTVGAGKSYTVSADCVNAVSEVVVTMPNYVASLGFRRPVDRRGRRLVSRALQILLKVSR
jgi:hypothetical protein